MIPLYFVHCSLFFICCIFMLKFSSCLENLYTKMHLFTCFMTSARCRWIRFFVKFFFFTFCVGVSILLMSDDAGIDFRRRTKLNRWQNQAIIQHKYIHLKRPGGAKWKLFIHNKWNTVHSRDVSVYSAKLYWIAMKENHCRGYLR